MVDVALNWVDKKDIERFTVDYSAILRFIASKGKVTPRDLEKPFGYTKGMASCALCGMQHRYGLVKPGGWAHYDDGKRLEIMEFYSLTPLGEALKSVELKKNKWYGSPMDLNESLNRTFDDKRGAEAFWSACSEVISTHEPKDYLEGKVDWEEFRMKVEQATEKKLGIVHARLDKSTDSK